MAKTTSTLTAVLTAAMALSLAGCGVKGSLEAPEAAKAEGAAKAPEAAATGENSAAKPKPHEPFVLDGLLR